MSYMMLRAALIPPELLSIHFRHASFCLKRRFFFLTSVLSGDTMLVFWEVSKRCAVRQ